MTHRTNKVIKRLLYDEQKQWHNEKNWSIFQDALLSKGVTSYRHPTNATAGLDDKIVFLGDENQINHFNANPAHIAKNIMVSRNGPQWEQVGADIDGEAAGDESGTSVSMSVDGTVVAISAYGNSNFRGNVRIYQYGENENGNYGWHKLGETIQGESERDYSGWSVSLSADGFTVAIGADMWNQNRPGHVRVYEYRKYTQDEHDASKFHHGSTLVNNDQNKPLIITENFDTPPVANNSYWIQKGIDIDGVNIDDQSGYSVSLSADGSVVAIGAIQSQINEDNGYVRIFKYSITDGNTDYSWNKLGTDIVWEVLDGQFGESLSLSADGTVVAIGDGLNDNSGANSGRVRVYKYQLKDTLLDWHPQGDNIEGEAAGDGSGRELSLSADGSVVAIGARFNNPDPDQTEKKAGHVRVYKYNPTKIDEQLQDQTAADYGPVGWDRLGADIDGDLSDHIDAPGNSGYASGLSLSNDGFIVAIGNPFTDTNGTNSGSVRIYQYEPSKTQEDGNGPRGWNRVGQDIYGEDLSGSSVSLSGDGSVVAIGATKHDADNKINSGHVRVFQIAKIRPWLQQGLDINGEAADDESGYSVSLSQDGSVMAIGAWKNDSNVSNSGHVRVYENKNGLWQQKGEDIDGEAINDYSGYSVSLNDNGSIVAIGAKNNDGDNKNLSGHVRVYEYNGSSWEQKGGDIDGEANYDYSGRSVSLSSNGLIVAIGAAFNHGANGSDSGHVRVYEYREYTANDEENGVSKFHYESSIVDGEQTKPLIITGDNNPQPNVGQSYWIQKGGDIDGEAPGQQSGYSVSLSADGSVVAIGALFNDEAGDRSGHVRVYEYKGSSWEQKGTDINGEAPDDRSGSSVSLSADGSVVAIGATLNDGANKIDSGHVRVYEYNGSSWEQKGEDIDGEAVADKTGASVALSADGSIVAIGATLNDGHAGNKSGHVRVYEYNGSSWKQKGPDIDGEAEGDESGYSVSMSADGSIVAIGARFNDASGDSSGHVRVYKFTGWGLGSE